MKKKGLITHPLTLLFGCVYIILGKQVETIVYLMVILIHEYAHFVAAAFCKVKMQGVEITPFGGCLKGELLGISPEKTLIITLSAPLINIFSSVLFFALWWIYPAIYPYTECVCYSNLAIGVINLLPCYPLDGGRAILALFEMKEKNASKVVFVLTIIFASLLFALFVLSIFYSINISFLMMSVFLFWGAFYDFKEDERTKRLLNIFHNKQKNAQIIKIIISGKEETYELINLISDKYYTYFVVMKEGKILKEIAEEEIINNCLARKQSIKKRQK